MEIISKQNIISNDVREKLIDTNKNNFKPIFVPNEILKRFIYIQHKSNINKFALELGVTRQYIWGIITGRLKPSITMARKICDKLGVEDTRLIFPDGSIDYPEIKSAYDILNKKEEFNENVYR
jgi:DNA-binding XRE family transcriptional regulator